MTYKTKVLLSMTVVLACGIFLGGGTASATVLCKSGPSTHVCPASDVYGKGTSVPAHLKSGTSAEFAVSGSTYISCGEGSIGQAISNPGSATSATELAEVAYKFSTCNYPASTVKKGLAAVTWISGTHNGSVAQANNEVSFNIGGVNCVYSIGAPAEIQGGASATLVYSKAAVVKTLGSFVCPTEMKLTATFVVEAPTPLYVEHEAAPAPASTLCSSNPESHSCPAGSVYGVGTAISAHSVPGSSIVLKGVGGETLASCESGGFSASVASAGGESSVVRLAETSHTYSGCTTTVTPISSGEAEVAWLSGTANGALTQTGGQTQWAIFGVNCTYSISGGEIVGGAGAKIVYNNTTVVKTAGGFLCPSKAQISGEYDVESPTPLYVER